MFTMYILYIYIYIYVYIYVCMYMYIYILYQYHTLFYKLCNMRLGTELYNYTSILKMSKYILFYQLFPCIQINHVNCFTSK